jgi:FkbM family methyltransferase
MPLTDEQKQKFREFLDFYAGNRELFASVELFPENKRLFEACVRAMGILNWETPELSGERRFLRELLSDLSEPVVLDVGAHAGDYCLMALEANPAARVFAFEPHPESFAKLAEAGLAHGFEVFPLGCSDAATGATLYDYAGRPGSQHASVYREVIEDIHKGAAEGHHIRLTRLDNFLAGHGLGRVDLLKIDTEGHEMAVLRGAEASIRSGAVRAIHFEFNEMNVFSRSFFRDFLDFLPEFRFFRLLPDGLVPLDNYKPLDFELFAYQNIAAVRQG